MKVQLIVRLYANCIIVCLYAIDCHTMQLIFYGVNDQPLREIRSIFVIFDCLKVQLFIR